MSFSFLGRKPQIDAHISKLLKAEEKNLSKVRFWGKDSLERLKSFALRGKSLRGSLVVFSHKLFQGTSGSKVFDVAAALELIHSALLIQDDILDRDLMRRGVRAVHRQYADLGARKKIKDRNHFGESAAICLADIGFFAAFGTLGRLSLNSKIRDELWRLFREELAITASGQMADMALAEKRQKTLSVYCAKTARYTFVLPVLAGAILAGKRRKDLQKVEKLSEILGIIFQLKDDELDKGGKGQGKEISRLVKKAQKLIWSLPVQEQKKAFGALLRYNLERRA
ncbi:MAG: polyprenyl synthetase family protein [bacterium]|nr:polyprenyl synthetase family protein [bacterium]